MKINESVADRIIRVLFGILLGILVTFKVVTGIIGIFFLIVSGAALITSLIGFCAIYAMFGLSTCKVPAHKNI